jgi:type I restriction enzyme, S subunit
MVRPGYKFTEAGEIPEDWEAIRLGQFVSLQRGHDLTERDRRRGEVPVMGSAGQNGFHDTAVAKGPGVLLGRSGASFGQAHFCACDFWPHNTALFVIDFLGNDPLYVYYRLRSLDFSRHNSGGAQQSLNRNFIAPILVAIPPDHEQRIIARAIRDAEDLLESLEHLLAKKRAIKQGAMQSLLTGAKRLPGFSEPWRSIPFSELARPRRDRIDPRTAGAGTFCIELEHLQSATGHLLGCTSTHAGASLKSVFRPGDVLFGKLRAYLRKYWLADRQGCCSTEIWVLAPTPEVVTSKFLYQLVTTDQFIEAASTAYGTHMPRSDWRVVSGMQISIPSLPEQAAIAEVLTDLDADLDATTAKLHKARAIKQGMMQELLTGRIRLV